MSIDQREQIRLFGSLFMKVTLGVAGASMAFLYYSVVGKQDQTRADYQKAIEKIEESVQKIEDNTDRIKFDVNLLRNDVNIIDYRLNQLEK